MSIRLRSFDLTRFICEKDRSTDAFENGRDRSDSANLLTCSKDRSPDAFLAWWTSDQNSTTLLVDVQVFVWRSFHSLSSASKFETNVGKLLANGILARCRTLVGSVRNKWRKHKLIKSVCSCGLLIQPGTRWMHAKQTLCKSILFSVITKRHGGGVTPH